MSSPLIPSPLQLPADLLRDRVLLITGAGDGLGRACSQHAAALGATVVLMGSQGSALETVYDDIIAAGGAEPALATVNLLSAKWSELDGIVESIYQTFGRLDGVLHAEEQRNRLTRLENIEPREWAEAIHINLTAAFGLTRLCLPLLRQSSDASVVFISDCSARQATAFHGAYGIAKAGSEAMMTTWATELRAESASSSGLRFNSYCPPPGPTAPGSPAPDTHRPHANPAAVSALLWLLGPDSRGISGHRF